MGKSFNTLIDSFIDSEVGTADNFTSLKLAGHLRDNISKLYKNRLFLSSGTGNNQVASQNKLVRSDVIYWLDRNHNDQFENDFFDLLDSFVLYLNQTCFTGITGYEFHIRCTRKGVFIRNIMISSKTIAAGNIR